MKSAFTMIELVFVIVILGILAAVAVPKLTASKEDAKYVITAENIVQVVKDFTNYYNAKNTFKSTALSSITNVNALTTTSAIDANGDGEFQFEPNGLNCIKLTVSEGSISLNNGTDTTSSLCTKLQALPAIKSYTFNGSGVTY